MFYLHHLHHSTFGSECALWWSLVDRHLHCIVDVVIDSSISIILIIMIPTSSFAFKSLARDAIPGTVTDRQTDRQSASKSAFNIVVLEYIEVSAGWGLCSFGASQISCWWVRFFCTSHGWFAGAAAIRFIVEEVWYAIFIWMQVSHVLFYFNTNKGIYLFWKFRFFFLFPGIFDVAEYFIKIFQMLKIKRNQSYDFNLSKTTCCYSMKAERQKCVNYILII